MTGAQSACSSARQSTACSANSARSPQSSARSAAALYSSRSGAETARSTASSAVNSNGSPVPFVPHLALSKKSPMSSNSMPMGGLSEKKWSSKTLSQPNAIPIFRKTVPSKRNESSVFTGSDRSSLSSRRGCRAGSNQMHSDPFSEMRVRYQPPLKARITHPNKPDDNRLHTKIVQQAERKSAPNELITPNGLTFSRGKGVNPKKFESARLMGTNMDCTPPRQKSAQQNLRYAASPKGTATGGLTHNSVLNPSTPRSTRPHTRTAPKVTSLKGVFKGEPLQQRKHTNRPPWHTSTPRQAAKKHTMRAPWSTGTPRGPVSNASSPAASPAGPYPGALITA